MPPKNRPSYRQPHSIYSDYDISREENPVYRDKLAEKRHGEEKHNARSESRDSYENRETLNTRKWNEAE